jgi:hypothetical protein
MTKSKPLGDFRQRWVEWYRGRKGPPPKPDFPANHRIRGGRMNTNRSLKTGKIQYASGVAARAATISMMLYGGHAARIYKCRWCPCFHVTRKQLKKTHS